MAFVKATARRRGPSIRHYDSIGSRLFDVLNIVVARPAIVRPSWSSSRPRSVRPAPSATRRLRTRARGNPGRAIPRVATPAGTPGISKRPSGPVTAR